MGRGMGEGGKRGKGVGARKSRDAILFQEITVILF